MMQGQGVVPFINKTMTSHVAITMAVGSANVKEREGVDGSATFYLTVRTQLWFCTIFF
jgi:hypothetical protein